MASVEEPLARNYAALAQVSSEHRCPPLPISDGPRLLVGTMSACEAAHFMRERKVPTQVPTRQRDQVAGASV
jgi:hypothetical protein